MDVAVGLVRSAADAEDREWLQRLARADDPDPWLVVDRLCELNAWAEAVLFAKAGDRPDTRALPAYIVALRDSGLRERARVKALRAAVGRGAVGPDLPAGTTVPGIRVFVLRAEALVAERRIEAAEKTLLSGARFAETLGWLRQAAWMLDRGATLALEANQPGEAAEALGRLYDLAKRRADPRGIARALRRLGDVNGQLGRTEQALKLLVQARGVAHEAELPEERFEAWRATSRVYKRTQDFVRARAALEQALATSQAIGDKQVVATAKADLARLQARTGQPRSAIRTLDDVLAARRKADDPAGVAEALEGLGEQYKTLAEYATALERWKQAREVHEERGDAEAVARVSVRIGEIYQVQGRYPRALRTFEAAEAAYAGLRQEAPLARVLARIATVHLAMRDYAAARLVYDRAQQRFESLGEPEFLLSALNEMSELCLLAGDGEEGFRCSMKAVEAARRSGNQRAEATGLLNAGLARLGTQDLDGAEQDIRAALRLFDGLRDMPGKARAEVHLGDVHRARKRYGQAVQAYTVGIEIAEGLGLAGIVITGRWALAETHLEARQPRLAIDTIRNAVFWLPEVLQGFGELRGALARTTYAPMLALGAGAALETGDAEAASFFLESARAGAFLETLGTNRSFKEALIPRDLRLQLEEARAKVARARQVLQEARATGRRTIIQFVRDALEAAERDERAAVLRVQTEQKAVADLMYPSADPIQVIQERLDPGDVLVLYGRAQRLDPSSGERRDVYVALALWPHRTRLVEIGTLDAVDAAVMGVRPASADTLLPASAISRARNVLVNPLELGADVKRVLVSPAGPIAFCPVSLLFGERDVALVPSGTTLGLLRGEEGKRGTGILALADPDYTGRVLGAETLPKLPATRAEAQAIGDKLLLGKEATEAALRAALARNPSGRWRAVHLACHGTVDEDQPLRSSLVVTADENDDGYLTAIELYQMRIPADCVSLSACETGLGKMARGEGVLGLVRGFMLAGAPRVVSSLWRVEDEATRALMVRFYELWHPEDGVGIGAAAALRQAQAYVAAQEKWKHPWYWSGWVLWGLPD